MFSFVKADMALLTCEHRHHNYALHLWLSIVFYFIWCTLHWFKPIPTNIIVRCFVLACRYFLFILKQLLFLSTLKCKIHFIAIFSI